MSVGIQIMKLASKAAASSALRMPRTFKPAPCLLVVEDDPMIRLINARVLAGVGFNVDLACDGLQAWEALQSHSYDLMVTDLDMPRLNGVELIEKIALLKLRIPVIITSGATAINSSNLPDTFPVETFLSQPFFGSELIAAVKKLLPLPPNNAVGIMHTQRTFCPKQPGLLPLAIAT